MTDDSLLSTGIGFDPTNPSSVNEVDGWIEMLMACKQLSEADVKRLCDKVGRLTSYVLTSRREKYCKKNRMFSPYTRQSLSVEIYTDNFMIYRSFLR